MNKPKLIAEIGCNHKGDLELAKQCIFIAKECGADAVKFQKRDNEYWQNRMPEQYNAPHPNPGNAYGKTYFEHRTFLELDVKQNKLLRDYCREIDIQYSSSVWDLNSAKDIASLEPVFIKIPSACNNDYETLGWLCDNYEGEIHISTGMTSKQELKELVEFTELKRRNQDIVLYGCTSGYPVPYDDVSLLEISYLKTHYGKIVKAIGFSGHHLGIAADVAALTLGAEFIERHFTLDKSWKGTDHAASLEPAELKQLAVDLDNVTRSLQFKRMDILPIEQVQRDKLRGMVSQL